jgi:DNA-directed RNA polymerase subunit RPC12/RpoP
MDGADWLRTQLTSFGCAACGQPWEAGHIRVLAERESLYFVDLACTRCGSQAVAIVTIQPEDEAVCADVADVPSVGAADGRAPADPVSADDVLAVHQLLEGYEGDLTDLLGRPDLDRPGLR